MQAITPGCQGNVKVAFSGGQTGRGRHFLKDIGMRKTIVVENQQFPFGVIPARPPQCYRGWTKAGIQCFQKLITDLHPGCAVIPDSDPGRGNAFYETINWGGVNKIRQEQDPKHQRTVFLHYFWCIRQVF